MRNLVLILALACVVVAGWLYLRSPSGAEASDEPVSPITIALAPAQPAQTGSLLRPEDPIARESTAVPTAPLTQESERVAPLPDPARAIGPDAIDLLTLEKDRLRKTLGEITTPILQSKFENGEATFLHAEQTYRGGKDDHAAIFMIHMDPERGTFRTDISRQERPDLYVMKDRTNAIDAEIKKILRERELAAAADQPK